MEPRISLVVSVLQQSEKTLSQLQRFRDKLIKQFFLTFLLLAASANDVSGRFLAVKPHHCFAFSRLGQVPDSFFHRNIAFYRPPSLLEEVYVGPSRPSLRKASFPENHDSPCLENGPEEKKCLSHPFLAPFIRWVFVIY